QEAAVSSAAVLPSTRHTLGSAVRALASVCDGAEQRDGAGFNKPDARWGALMALDDEERWHPSHKWGVWVTLQKYKKQLLNSFGIDFDQIPAPEENNDYIPLPEIPTPKPLIKVRDGAFLVGFEYDASIVSAIRRISSASYNGRTDPHDKTWSVKN